MAEGDVATQKRGAGALKVVRGVWIAFCSLGALSLLLDGSLFGALAVILAAMLAIRPVADWTARKGVSRAARLSGAVVLFFAGAMIAGSQAKHEKDGALEITGPSPASPPSSVSSPSPVASPSTEAAAQAAFVDLYRTVLAAAGPCDKGVTVMGKAASSGDAFAGYRAAQNGHNLCQSAAMTINGLEPPNGLNDQATEATGKALEVCRNGYISRQTAMASAMKAFDGDARPSVVAEVVDGLKAGQAGVLMCVVGFMDAAAKAGVDTDRLK